MHDAARIGSPSDRLVSLSHSTGPHASETQRLRGSEPPSKAKRRIGAASVWLRCVGLFREVRWPSGCAWIGEVMLGLLAGWVGTLRLPTRYSGRSPLARSG